MNHRISQSIPMSGFARQFKTDLQVLTRAGDYRNARLTDRAVALDRIAGTSVLFCAAALLTWLVATQTALLDIPSAMASTAYQATFGTQFNPDETLAAKPMKARDIRVMQRKLKQLGFDPGAIDGVAGKRTLEALNRYREAKHLEQVSAIDRGAAGALLD